MSLADHFSEHTSDKVKKLFTLEKVAKLEPGMVIKRYDDEANKEKWFIVLGVDDDNVIVGCVRINSIINRNIFRTIDLEALVYPLKKEKNPFLDWDSHVDCMNLVQKNHDDYLDHINNNPQMLLGNIYQEDLDLIKKTVCDSSTITPKQIKKFNLQ